jgi:hypothetical protein
MTAAETYRLEERNSAHKAQLLPVALVRCAYMLDMEDIGACQLQMHRMADILKEKQEDDRMTSLALQNIMQSNPQGYNHVPTQNLMRNKVKP